MSKTEILRVIGPGWSDDDLTIALRRLTRTLSDLFPDIERGYGLGGENGYGVDFENDTFMMHHFCWCGGYDCPWCSYSDEDGAHFQARFEPNGAVEGYRGGQAPNFWYKPTGFRVWWYKWIGRDNETFGNAPDIEVVIAECVTSARPT